MKLIKYKLPFIIALIVAFASCSKDWLETQPTDQVSNVTAFSSVANAQLALNGTYRLLYEQIDNQSQDGHGAMMINMDAMGEDFVWSGNTYSYFKPAYRWNQHNVETGALALFPYQFYFRIIANTNGIINNIDALPGAEESKNAIKGEALALRAWSYYYLVQLYGKRYDAQQLPNSQPAVPLSLVSATMETSTVGIPRATVEEVYAQINEDLDEAVKLLGSATARTVKTHINLQVAQGFKARVALTMQHWDEAASFARLAQSGGTLMSNTDYLAGFTSIGNVEWMWGANQLSSQVPTYGSFYAYMSTNFNSSWNRLEPKLINSLLYDKIAATDIRKKLWWDGTTAEKANFTGAIDAATGKTASASKILKYMHRKFVVADYSNKAGDIPYMRLAEMYLIEAEALARAGKDQDAANVLYTLAVKRNPSYVKSTKTGTDLIEEIMVQRRIELWGEGFRFLDLKRTNTPLNRNGANHLVDPTSSMMSQSAPSGNNNWQYKIPLSEINANPAIGPANQNP